MTWLLPPILFAFLTIYALLISFLGPNALALHHWSASHWLYPLGFISLAGGLLFLIGGRLAFAKEQAEIMTFNKSTRLVTRGVFAYSRNPMYLGFTLLLLAIALFLHNIAGFLAPILFLFASAFWYIPFEESRMRENFGDEYDAYAKRVRRWI